MCRAQISLRRSTSSLVAPPLSMTKKTSTWLSARIACTRQLVGVAHADADDQESAHPAIVPCRRRERRSARRTAGASTAVGVQVLGDGVGQPVDHRLPAVGEAHRAGRGRERPRRSRRSPRPARPGGSRRSRTRRATWCPTPDPARQPSRNGSATRRQRAPRCRGGSRTPRPVALPIRRRSRRSTLAAPNVTVVGSSPSPAPCPAPDSIASSIVLRQHLVAAADPQHRNAAGRRLRPRRRPDPVRRSHSRSATVDREPGSTTSPPTAAPPGRWSW